MGLMFCAVKTRCIPPYFSQSFFFESESTSICYLVTILVRIKVLDACGFDISMTFVHLDMLGETQIKMTY